MPAGPTGIRTSRADTPRGRASSFPGRGRRQGPPSPDAALETSAANTSRASIGVGTASLRELVLTHFNNSTATESRSEERGGGMLAIIPVKYHGRARIRVGREAGGALLVLCFN